MVSQVTLCSTTSGMLLLVSQMSNLSTHVYSSKCSSPSLKQMLRLVHRLCCSRPLTQRCLTGSYETHRHKDDLDEKGEYRST